MCDNSSEFTGGYGCWPTVCNPVSLLFLAISIMMIEPLQHLVAWVVNDKYKQEKYREKHYIPQFMVKR